MANPKTISQVLAEIALLYPTLFSPTAETAAVWSRYLRDMDDDLLMAALRHYVATASDNYPPSVPALRQAAAELMRKAAGVPLAFEAWEDLISAGNGERIRVEMEGGKAYVDRQPYQWKHSLVEAVARQLGWPGRFPGQNAEADRAHFTRAYDAAVGKALEETRELPEVQEFVQRKSLVMAGELVKRLEAK